MRFAAPLWHRSEVRVLGPLIHAPAEVERETPLFAAGLDFARDQGGPLTRAFLEALELEGQERVVVDSSLVWLAPGLAHGFQQDRARGPRAPLRFVHQPFPGSPTGVRGESNRNQAAWHRLCVLGLDCTPEVAVGEFAFASPQQAEAFWFPSGQAEARDERDERDELIERRLQAGSLNRVEVPLATLVEYGWGTLLRPRPASASGFQFVIRATSGDPRPIVNGRRNHAML